MKKEKMKVYVLVSYKDELKKYTRIKVDFINNVYIQDDIVWLSFEYIWHDQRLTEFGKTIFSTMEEAENALNNTFII